MKSSNKKKIDQDQKLITRRLMTHLLTIRFYSTRDSAPLATRSFPLPPFHYVTVQNVILNLDQLLIIQLLIL